MKYLFKWETMISFVICAIISVFFIDYFTKECWISTYSNIINLHFDGNAFQLYIAQLSITFISLSVFSVLTDNTKIIYWENIVERNLIRGRFINYYAKTIYIYMMLIWGFIALAFGNKMLLLIYFIISLFLLMNISIRIIDVYHSEKDKEMMLQSEYTKIFCKQKKDENKKDEYDRIYDYLEKYTIEGFESNDIKTIHRNLKFLENNIGTIRPDSFEKIYKRMQSSNYGFKLKKIIYKELIAAFKDEFTSMHYDEKSEIVKNMFERERFYHYFQYQSVVGHLFNDSTSQIDNIYFNALYLMAGALFEYRRIIDKCDPKQCELYASAITFEEDKILMSENVNMLLEKYKDTYYVHDYYEKLVNGFGILYWNLIGYTDSLHGFIHGDELILISKICKSLHPLLHTAYLHRSLETKGIVNRLFDIDEIPDDIKDKYGITGVCDNYFWADEVKNAVIG